MKNDGTDVLMEAKEQLSAYMDDALEPELTEDFLTRLKSSPELQATWQRYHLISHVLQQKCEPALIGLGAMLCQRVSAQIAQEPAVVWGAEFDKPAMVHAQIIQEDPVLQSKN